MALIFLVLNQSQAKNRKFSDRKYYFCKTKASFSARLP